MHAVAPQKNNCEYAHIIYASQAINQCAGEGKVSASRMKIAAAWLITSLFPQPDSNLLHLCMYACVYYLLSEGGGRGLCTYLRSLSLPLSLDDGHMTVFVDN